MGKILGIRNPKRLTQMLTKGKLRAFKIGDQKFGVPG
jgi:hypothetical protein